MGDVLTFNKIIGCLMFLISLKFILKPVAKKLFKSQNSAHCLSN